MTRVTIRPEGPLRGRLRMPGDKSISHRALLIGALAEGTSSITGLSNGHDVACTAAAVEAMGAVISNGGDTIFVTGGRSRLHEPNTVIDLGNSGTSARLMTGWCASKPWSTFLQGDSSLHERPMRRVVDPLRSMGAVVGGRNDGDRLPLYIHGGPLNGIDHELSVPSAQVKSAILFAGLDADGQTVVRESTQTRVHTEEMLAQAGADIHVQERNDSGAVVSIRRSELRAIEITVPGDPSHAAFWIVAALVVPGSEITIENVYVGAARAGLIDVLMRMGGDIQLSYSSGTRADIHVRYSQLEATDVNGDEVPSMVDELPVLAVAAAFAEGTTNVSEAAELRVKESDRIAAITEELGALGIDISERSDGFSVKGSPDGAGLRSCVISPRLDHRIAMTAAVAAMAAKEEVTVEDWECVSTSYPGFLDDLRLLREDA